MRTWNGPPLQVIGLGLADSQLSLGETAQQALQQAEVVIGAQRHLALLPELTAERVLYPSPFAQLWTVLQRYQGQRVVLLASGDPLFYGLGGHLRRYLAAEQLHFHPHISSIQAAFARIGQPWQHAQVVSLHGRPLLSLRAHLQANRWYALLTDADSHPSAIAQQLCAANLADSQVWVAEHLGSAKERISQHQAATLAAQPLTFAALNVVLVHTAGVGGILPEFPGIPDAQFITNSSVGRGLLTKREVRLAVLSLLQPRAGEVGWDIGAGCGGVAVEWARWNPLGQVYALERDTERLQYLAANREQFGVLQSLTICPGSAPEALGDLPDPQAVFIGGGGADLDRIMQHAWARLASGGRMVVSAVTVDSQCTLYQHADTLQLSDQHSEWLQISVSRGERLAGQRLLRPQLPVLLLKAVKP